MAISHKGRGREEGRRESIKFFLKDQVVLKEVKVLINMDVRRFSILTFSPSFKFLCVTGNLQESETIGNFAYI